MGEDKMRIKSKSQDELEREDIKRMLDNVSFPCPRMDLLHGILLQFQRAWLIAPSMTPPPHTNQRCTMTPMENKMSEIKTVTHEGKVYQIGKYYLFNSGGDYWHWLKLKRLVTTIPLTFEVWVTCSKFTVFSFIKEVPASENMGTITPAPIKLIDGAAYMFDYEGRKVDRIGIYLKHDNHFVFPIGSIHTTNCTNIRLMTVESKQ
jgi:hypothetical protein